MGGFKLNIVKSPSNGHTWEPAFRLFLERLSSFGGLYKGTFKLSFVERFVSSYRASFIVVFHCTA